MIWKGKRQLLKFEIGPNYAILRQKKDPELQHLVNKKMSPEFLLHVNKFNLELKIYLLN